LETEDNPLENIASFVYKKLKYFLPKEVMPSTLDKAIISNMVNRIKNMNKFYETIKHKDFSYYDDFYGIHGHHRRNHEEKSNS
jgi:hypothetical protein